MKNPTLLNHIRSLNAQIAAETPGEYCYLTWVEDVEHWEKYGITTPEEFDHYALVAEASDLSKVAFGRKMSWASLNALSDSELQQEIGYYRRTIREEREAEAAYAQAVVREEAAHRSRVAEILSGRGPGVTDGLVSRLLEEALG